MQNASKVNLHFSDWKNKSIVRSGRFKESPDELFDENLTDYPDNLLPFIGHPAYEALDDRIKSRIGSFAWIAWNKRVVDTEELIIGPALACLIANKTDITLKGIPKMAIRQAIVDEYFHSHMHDIAVGITIENRSLSQEDVEQLDKPALLYRRYQEVASDLPEQWQKDIALLVWCVIGELSIYEFLTFVSKDETVQPASRSLVGLHERDEAVHASLIQAVMEDNYQYLSEEQKSCFEACLPYGLSAFSAVDWVIWQDVLRISGVKDSEQIIKDVINDSSISNTIPLNRSFVRIKRFCENVGISTEDIF
ncbi:para-aminobenzoate N-oxygenase AurF [Sinobacterium caligoides]|uniref:Para-aminobenzoate N-oxygenase AurF n=1 Tax=Sinobacterium caligoides TaxID=933926 RepID=A0A3N2E0A9_9GAMM|nr:diiron oxygenase [Sinobacterium caligoides]ROS05524.1 para-aminobenzoate N-oxygenase AurF [Sinobacterium caligoides]